MSADWYPGIREFCEHWRHAPMLQQTFAALEREFADDNDACIDAAKAMVECTCRIIIENLDAPASPLKPKEQHPDFGAWMSAAVRVLKLSEIRDEAFKKLISQYYKLTTTLGDLRNKAGSVSHGKDGFISKLSIHQRRASLLAADAIVTFLHEAYLEREPDPVLTLEPFGRFAESNAIIDEHTAIVVEADEDAFLQARVLLPYDEEITLTVEPSRLLFGVDREAYKLALNACRDAAASKLSVDEEVA